MIGTILSMFGGSGGKQRETVVSSIPDKYSTLEGALRTRDSALAAGRDPIQYKGFLPQKQQPSKAENTIDNIKNYIGSKKSNAIAKVRATEVKAPVGTEVEELKADLPAEEQLAFKSPDYTNKITSENYFDL